MIYNSMLLLHVLEQMKQLILNKQTCRRQQLKNIFQNSFEKVSGCQCCDVCGIDCICDEPHNETLIASFKVNPPTATTTIKQRQINLGEREQIEFLAKSELVSGPTFDSLSFPAS